MTNTTKNAIAQKNLSVVGVRFVTEHETEASELYAYCSFLVAFRDSDGFEVERPCDAEVGVPGYLRGTAEACGSTRGLLSAEWCDSSDWSELPDQLAAEAALGAIAAKAGRLLREAIQARKENSFEVSR